MVQANTDIGAKVIAAARAVPTPGSTISPDFATMRKETPETNAKPQLNGYVRAAIGIGALGLTLAAGQYTIEKVQEAFESATPYEQTQEIPEMDCAQGLRGIRWGNGVDYECINPSNVAPEYIAEIKSWK